MYLNNSQGAAHHLIESGKNHVSRSAGTKGVGGGRKKGKDLRRRKLQDLFKKTHQRDTKNEGCSTRH